MQIGTSIYQKFIAGVFILSLINVGNTFGAESNQKEGPMLKSDHSQYQKAAFAAGCFWGIQYSFAQLKGVVATQAGYMGGHVKNPTYEQVCTNQTGHAESVQVIYDPKIISYEELLKTFWEIHDPTQSDGQGPDIGTQYRSAIFYFTPEQQQKAKASKDALAKSGEYDSPIATEITAATDFYPAEEYHQQYYAKKGMQPVCAIPKKKK